MTDITNIPLNKLTLWTGNVRKVRNKTGIDALAASIKAHGLQQNLIVRKDGKKFAVVAGGRRLKALQQLAKTGDIQAAHDVPCRITEAENATELSLAENVMREDMHPADQFKAFQSLADEGLPVTDIAARFGSSEVHVQKLLKLARVSAKIIKAYRNDELTLECVMAFTVTDEEHTGKLGTVLNLDMKTWFTPTADNYFSQVSKPQILEALTAARNQPPAPAWEKLKKAELSALAERETAGTGWLPDILR